MAETFKYIFENIFWFELGQGFLEGPSCLWRCAASSFTKAFNVICKLCGGMARINQPKQRVCASEKAPHVWTPNRIRPRLSKNPNQIITVHMFSKNFAVKVSLQHFGPLPNMSSNTPWERCVLLYRTMAGTCIRRTARGHSRSTLLGPHIIARLGKFHPRFTQPIGQFWKIPLSTCVFTWRHAKLRKN